MATSKKEKKGFQMPHLLFLMLGLILLVSVLTYIIPAGTFAAKADGTLDGSLFNFLGAQTPVSPWQALLSIIPGLRNSGLMIGLLLIAGGATTVVLDSGAIDELINWAIYKLQDKGTKVLLPILFILMGLLGGFGGGDYLIAIVPIGLLFAKKLRLDPICAVAVTFFAAFVGFGNSPTKLMIPQVMMEVPVYSGFGTRFIVMMLMIIMAMLFTLRYALKIQKNPEASLMGNTDWLNEASGEAGLQKTEFSMRAAIVTFLFFAQYIVIVCLMLFAGYSNEVMGAVQIIVCIVCGLIYGMSGESIGNSFAKGAAGMAFVCVVIGLAGTMSIVLTQGNILHTIVYYACLPLQGLSKGLAAVGMSIVISIINVFIPSASSKAAILMPIVKPMSENLGMSANLAVSAFQFGDGFTNLITPFLGVTAGSVATAKVPFDKWVKWALPCVLVCLTISFIILYFLGTIGWTGL